MAVVLTRGQDYFKESEAIDSRRRRLSNEARLTVEARHRFLINILNIMMMIVILLIIIIIC